MELGDVRGGELAGRDPVGEEDVQLAVGTALGLREAEEGPHDAEEVEAEPEEAGLRPPAPGAGVQHVGRPDVVDDADDVVGVAGEDDGLGAEAGGGQLGDEGVADGADGEVVCGGGLAKGYRLGEGGEDVQVNV